MPRFSLPSREEIKATVRVIRAAAGKLRSPTLVQPVRSWVVLGAVDAGRAAVGFAAVEQLAVLAHHEGVTRALKSGRRAPDDLVILVAVIAQYLLAELAHVAGDVELPRFMKPHISSMAGSTW